MKRAPMARRREPGMRHTRSGLLVLVSPRQQLKRGSRVEPILMWIPKGEKRK